jgi:hypothetical protein
MRTLKNPDEPTGLTHKQRTEWRKSHGLCVRCITNPICYERSKRLCEACLESDRIYFHQRAKRNTPEVMLARLTRKERLQHFERCIDTANALGMSYGQYMATLSNESKEGS